MKLTRRQLKKHVLRGRRGQSMMSYAVIVSFLLIGVTTTGFAIMPKLLSALNSFTESMYFAINLPFP